MTPEILEQSCGCVIVRRWLVPDQFYHWWYDRVCRAHRVSAGTA